MGAPPETAVVWKPYPGSEGIRSLDTTMVEISRGDLEQLDKVITFINVMAELFDDGFYDDLWNLRERMIRFEPGHEHFHEE